MTKEKKHNEPSKSKKVRVDLHLPSWAYVLAAAAVLLLIVYLRLSYLSYDPPVDVFWSQDVWTDPPQYTSYARNAVLFGDWSPLHDPRLVLFMKNTTGALAYLVFSLFGVGFWQSNLVGVLFSLGAIVFVSLGIIRLKGRLAGILCAFLLGINYLFLTYGRLPFLENAMNFWLALTVFFLALGSTRVKPEAAGGFVPPKAGWYVAAGASCAVAAFFGKMIALHAFPAFLTFAAFTGWRETGGQSRRRWLVPSWSFLAGFAVVALFWLAYAYLPADENVRKYLSEQTAGLYGSPEGLRSLSGFYNRVFSFGADTRLFVHAPVIAALGFIGAALAVLPLGFRGKFGERLRLVKPEYLLVGLWAWAAYLALMPWNYRPLRYETVLLIPLAAATALVLSALVRRKPSPPSPRETSLPLMAVLGTLLFTLPVYHLVTAPFVKQQMGQAHSLAALLAIVIALGGTLLLNSAYKSITFGWRKIAGSTRLPEAAIALVVIAALVIQGQMILGWWRHAQKSMVSASRELSQVLGPDAVLVGSYATGLTLENRLKNVVYMFGVANVNTTLFADYPITHLAIIDDRKDRAFTDYGDVTRLSRKVTSFLIGNRPVGIFRVTENTPNEKARAYEPTAYEQAMRCYDLFQEDSMQFYIDRFAREHPDDFTVARFRGLYFMRDSTFDSASVYFAKAARLYPDDFAVHFNLAHCEMMLFEQTQNVAHFQNAQAHFREVLRLKPEDPAMRARLEPLLKR